MTFPVLKNDIQSHIDARWSTYATTMHTNKLVQNFTKKDLDLFKNELYSHLNVSNEVEFLSKIMILICNKLSMKTIISLNKTANNIFEQSGYPSIKWSNDCPFPQLPSSIIQHIGTFISQKDCVNKFGQVNKH